jgi:hypothetical protein
VRLKKIFTVLLALLLIPIAFAPAAFAATGGGVFYVDEAPVDDGNTDQPGGDPVGGPGGDPGTLVDPSKDGKYYVNVSLYHATLSQPSMGNVAFEKNPKALVITSGGRSVIQVATTPVETSGYTTAITEVEGATVIESASFTTNTKYDGTAHDITYVKVFQLNIPSTSYSGTQSIPVRFKVPYTPMDIVLNTEASGGWLSARLRIDWDSVSSASSDAELNPSESVATGTSSLDATDAPAVSLTDSATGIELTASAGVVPKDAELSVKAITSGADFTKAETALKEVLATEEAPKFKLYDISLIQSKVAIQPDGTVTISVPIPSDYDKAKVVFYRINDDGTATLIKGKVSGSNYEVGLSRLSLYALAEGLEDVNDLSAAGDVSRFTDIAGHWAYDAIKFVVERGLFNGTGGTTFSPNTAMDSGMFVTVLGRLEGVDAAAYTATPFTDVKAGAYYAPYAAWASANGIASGVGGGLFAPTKQITRQEMAAMLGRYVNFKGLRLSSDAQVTFADDAAIAAWAKDGVYALAFAGILNGVGDNNYAPARTATRAEVATMLMRFVEGYGG